MPRTKSDLSKEKFINSLRKNEISRNEAIVVLNKIIAEASGDLKQRNNYIKNRNSHLISRNKILNLTLRGILKTFPEAKRTIAKQALDEIYSNQKQRK